MGEEERGKEGRRGGREGWRVGGKEGGREEGREGWREEGGREEGGRERGREGRKEGGDEKLFFCFNIIIHRILEEVYEDLGDTLAIQYGGSHLVHRLCFELSVVTPWCVIELAMRSLMSHANTGPWRKILMLQVLFDHLAGFRLTGRCLQWQTMGETC